MLAFPCLDYLAVDVRCRTIIDLHQFFITLCKENIDTDNECKYNDDTDYFFHTII